MNPALLFASVGGNEVLTALTAGLDARQSIRNDGGDHVVDGGLVMSAQSGQIQLGPGDVLGDRLGVLAGSSMALPSQKAAPWARAPLSIRCSTTTLSRGTSDSSTPSMPNRRQMVRSTATVV